MKNNKKVGQILKTILCISIVFSFHLFPFTSYAQKYACVNTDYVLKNIPDYSNAQKRLDKYVEDWQKEIQDKATELESMRSSFEQESYLLPDNIKKHRIEDIKEKEQEIKTLQLQRFGAGGDLDKKRSELLKPVQDRVYSAIERIAHEKNYAFVFDKAGSATVLFVNKKYDISDDVLEQLGYKPGENNTPEPPKQEQSGKASRGNGNKPTNGEMNNHRGLDHTPPPPLAPKR